MGQVSNPIFLPQLSNLIVSVALRLVCLKPLRGSASVETSALFNPQRPNATSTGRPLAPPSSLVVVAVNLVKVHLHHVDPTAG